jgi:drug/metabolite transporter (DMT)-like permease
MSVVTAGVAMCFPALKAGLTFSPPLKFAALRTLIAGLALLAAAPLMRQSVWLPKRLATWVLPLGLVATTFTFGSMFLSPMFTSTAVASVLGNAQPLAIIVFAAIFLGESITRWKAYALVLGLTGVILITMRAAGGTGPEALLGATLAFGSSLSAAGASIMFKRLMPAKSFIALTGWQMVAGSLPLFGLSFLFERHLAIQWNLAFIGILLALALIGSALTTVLWVWLLQKYEAGSLSLYLFLTPVFAIVTTFVTFRERLDWIQLGGVAAILAGIAFELLRPRPAPVNSSIE